MEAVLYKQMIKKQIYHLPSSVRSAFPRSADILDTELSAADLDCGAGDECRSIGRQKGVNTRYIRGTPKRCSAIWAHSFSRLAAIRSAAIGV